MNRSVDEMTTLISIRSILIVMRKYRKEGAWYSELTKEIETISKIIDEGMK